MSDHQCKPTKCRRRAVEMQAEIDRLRAEAHDNTGLLSLLYDIRVAAGDKEARLMQSELVELIARQRVGSDRWCHARKLLTEDDIEGAQGCFDSFGGIISEEECAKADAAIDAAMSDQRSK